MVAEDVTDAVDEEVPLVDDRGVGEAKHDPAVAHDRGFATPVGGRYASDSMLLAMEPEMVSAMTKFVPDFMKAMPGIMKKVEKATAHLPPPPKPASIEEDEETPEESKS